MQVYIKAINTFCLFKNTVSGCALGNRSENIGRRLASQQGLEGRTECAKRDVLFSPYVNEKFPKKGNCLTKCITWENFFFHFAKATLWIKVRKQLD